MWRPTQRNATHRVVDSFQEQQARPTSRPSACGIFISPAQYVSQTHYYYNNINVFKQTTASTSCAQMPSSSMHRRTNAVLDSIYADYSIFSSSSAEGTTSSDVPLTLDYSKYYSNTADYEDKPLPPPPPFQDPDSIVPLEYSSPSSSPLVKLAGRATFGIDRGISPLRTTGLSRRPALRQSSRSHYSDDTPPSSASPSSEEYPTSLGSGWRTPSIGSVESIWFSSPAAASTRGSFTSRSDAVPRSVPQITRTDYSSGFGGSDSWGSGRGSGYDSPVDSFESGFSVSSSEAGDSWGPGVRNRVRIFQYPTSSSSSSASSYNTPTTTTTTSAGQEIFVGPIYEVLNYIWDTLSHPSNLATLIATFTPLGITQDSVISLLRTNSLPLRTFLQSADLEVHINPPCTPHFTTLSTLQIQLSPTLVAHLTNPATPTTEVTTIKALIRIAVLYQVGEYIHNHVLLRSDTGDGTTGEVLISPSIDVVRRKRTGGGDIAVVGVLGGNVSFRWRGGRCEVLFRNKGEVRRVPRRVVEEMWRSVKVGKFNVDELDL